MESLSGLEIPQESGVWSALFRHTADLPTLLKTSPDTHPYDAEFLPIQRELAQQTQKRSFSFFLKWKQKDKLVLSLFPGSPDEAVRAISRQPFSQVILSLTVLAKGPPAVLKGAGKEVSTCTSCLKTAKLMAVFNFCVKPPTQQGNATWVESREKT